MRHIFSLFILTSLFGCSTEIKNDSPLNIETNNRPFKLADIEIPKDWIEVRKINGEWHFASEDGVDLGCAVRLYENDGPVCMVTCGGDGQWHGINEVVQSKDSIQFFVYYPPDSSDMTFTMTYLDRTRNIVNWNIDGFLRSYIAAKDTVHFKKIPRPSDEYQTHSDTSEILETR